MRKPAFFARILPIVHDTVMAVAALYVALLLRYGQGNLPPREVVFLALATFGVLAAISFQAVGLGRGIWRFTSLADLRAIALAATISVLAFLLAMFLINRLGFIPRSVPLISWFVLIVFLGAPRMMYRILRDGGLRGVARSAVARSNAAGAGSLLIVGSTSDADRVARALGLDRENREVDAVGIVDIDSGSRGLHVRGVPILGGVDDFDDIVRRLAREGRRPGTVVVAAPREHQTVLRQVAAAAARAKLPIKRVAASSGLLDGATATLQPVTLDDLLGRPPVSLDLTRIRDLVDGRTVLVTGAGGSIGAEICRQVAALAPRRLLLFDISEFNLYTIDGELASAAPAVDRSPIIGSVRDRERIERLFREERPEIVFHAAALKHVPLVEANPCEGVLTNVAGTRIVADAAVAAAALAMVVISTDKAIRPTSVMGATKKVAESYCQILDVGNGPTRFITVRFGNVLGSTGSVVPLFEEQIRRGGPVTVTHPDMERYFMTIREATELVLQAAAHGLAHPEQAGCIHVLDMGEPVRIVDLARTMIALAGLRPDEDIDISFIGIRPGERLFEAYFDSDETTAPSAAPGVLVASPRLIDRTRQVPLLDQLCAAAEAGDESRVRTLLAAVAPPAETIAPPAGRRTVVVEANEAGARTAAK